jgi:ribonuclease R
MVPKTLTGRLVRHRDGYGFVIPDKPLPGVQGDVFISPLGIGDAMHGDQVQVRLGQVDARGRVEGRISKVLARAHATVVGQFRRGRQYDYVVPQDERIVAEILIPHADPAPEDRAIVDVEITRFPSATQKARGRIVEILGKPGDFGIDVEIVIRKHRLPHRFPPEALEAAARAPQFLSARDTAGRRDFRHLPIVTIDGETARDFDDAVYVERLPSGNLGLQVHIADVSHYVQPGSALDLEARLRGTSVYFPDRAVPMLPVELSNGICSLNPQVERLVLSCLMEIDHQGEVVAHEFSEGVIRSAERMTYTAVNLVLEGDPGMRERYAPLAERFALMRELEQILQRQRRRRGSIDFDLPEPEIEFDEFGEMVSIVRSERNVAHRIIEEFMLAANETVAAHFAHHQIPALYRIHEKPDPKRVLEFEEIAAGFGYSLGVGGLAVDRFRVPSGRGAGREGRGRGARGRPTTVEVPKDIPITPRHYQRLSEQIAGKPEERVLAFLMLRSLKQARYAPGNVGHFGLAAPVYTHFTSPIRRYPDLIVHRILKGQRLAETELQAIGEESSDAERRAQDAERELIEWKKVNFMAERVGEEFDALIISVQKYGFFVELTEVFVEGLVHMDTLDEVLQDRHWFREPARQIIGERTKRRFGIGGRLRVRVERVDPVARKISFAPVG